VHPLFEGEALILWAERPAPAAGWAGPGPARWAGTWPPPHPGALAPDALRALLRTGLSPEGPPSGNLEEAASEKKAHGWRVLERWR
jgi:hypothetical protein